MNTSRVTARKTALFGIIAVIFGMTLVSVSDAGIGRNGISGGRITAFGSIFVNGRELDTTTAGILLDGRPATVSDLRLGQNVVASVSDIVDGAFPGGVAGTVTVDSVINGEIMATDDKNLSFTVLGKTVVTDVETIFASSSGGTGFADFAAGDRVRISGFRTAGGDILASRVAAIAADSDNLFAGVVDKLSATAFSIDDVRIDTAAAQFIGFASGAPAQGDQVRVRSKSFGNNGELIASTVEFVPGVAGTIGDIGEIEGLVRQFESANSFKVGTIQVLTDSDTAFTGGRAENLASDTSVEVFGDFNVAGDLVARAVAIRGSRIRVSGQVDASNEPSLTVLGIELTSNPETRIKDSTGSGGNAFTVGQIVAGDYVEVRSLMNPPDTTPVLAARIERKKLRKDALLQGFVSGVDAPTVTVLGTAVLTTGNTRFFDANDDKITSQQFFAATTAGAFVKVAGAETSFSSVAADKISLQISN